MNDSRSLSRKVIVERYKPNEYDKPLKTKKEDKNKRSSVRFDQDYYEKELQLNVLQPPSPHFGSLSMSRQESTQKRQSKIDTKKRLNYVLP